MHLYNRDFTKSEWEIPKSDGNACVLRKNTISLQYLLKNTNAYEKDYWNFN